MCRFVAWIGAPLYLDGLILDQKQSLVEQSRNAMIGKTPINADGFGLAWYADRKTPCLYKDTHPSWSDANLKQLAHHVKSPLFLAHVRASTGTATSRNNCHPFAVENWSFMHNGQVGGHLKFRQSLDGLIPPALYDSRFGATESEAIFLIALGYGLRHEPLEAMARALATVTALAKEQGEAPYLRFAGCWTDGRRLFAGRIASDGYAPSLFYRTHKDGHVIASEPLDEDPGQWTEVQPGTAIEIARGALKEHAFKIDVALEHNAARVVSHSSFVM